MILWEAIWLMAATLFPLGTSRNRTSWDGRYLGSWGEPWDVHIVDGDLFLPLLLVALVRQCKVHVIYLLKHDIHIDILLSMYLYMNICVNINIYKYVYSNMKMFSVHTGDQYNIYIYSYGFRVMLT